MTALVLSGGGLWATAGIGVVQALKELGIRPDVVVGSSAGAVIGALICAGISVEDVKELALSLTHRDFPVGWRRVGGEVLGHRRLPDGIMDPRPFWSKVSGYLGDRGFSDLVCPLWVVATAISHRKMVVFGSADFVHPEGARRLGFIPVVNRVSLMDALTASAAVPGLFAPVRMGDLVLVDGGVGDDYPVDVAHLVGATRIIGVWVDEPVRWVSNPRPPHFVEVLMESMAMMVRELSLLRQVAVPLPRLDIRIELSGGHRVFHRIGEIIDQGYRATYRVQDQLRQLLAS